MVPDTPDVAEVLFGADGVAAGLRDLGQDRRRHELDLADRDQGFAARSPRKAAAMSTRRCRAARSAPRPPRSPSWSAAPESDFAKVKPLFELMGKNITLVGEVGAGQTTKVANQIIVALTIEAVGEALLFASKAGADPAKVRQALMGGFASSRILEVHGERMIKRTFDPGFRIELHQKDLNLALSRGAGDGHVAAQHRDDAGTLQRDGESQDCGVERATRATFGMGPKPSPASASRGDSTSRVRARALRGP
jgi:2-hydroxy-3-oxopropionate reductase